MAKYEYEAAETTCKFTKDRAGEPVPLTGFRLRSKTHNTVFECPIRAGFCPLLNTCRYDYDQSPRVVNSGSIAMAREQARTWYGDESRFFDILFPSGRE